MKNALCQIDQTRGALRMLHFLSSGIVIRKMVLRQMLSIDGVGGSSYKTSFDVLQNLGLIKTEILTEKGHRVQKVSITSEGKPIADLIAEMDEMLPNDQKPVK